MYGTAIRWFVAIVLIGLGIAALVFSLRRPVAIPSIPQSVRLASTAYVDVTQSPLIIDGVSVLPGDLVLLLHQDAANGVYVYAADGTLEQKFGVSQLENATLVVREGDQWAKTVFIAQTDAATKQVTMVNEGRLNSAITTITNADDENGGLKLMTSDSTETAVELKSLKAGLGVVLTDADSYLEVGTSGKSYIQEIARESLTAGQLVGICALRGGVSLAFRSAVSKPHGITLSEQPFLSTRFVCGIGGNKLAYLINGEGALSTQVAEINPLTLAVTVSNHVTTLADYVAHAICKLDDNKFAMMYTRFIPFDTNVYYRIVTLSNGVLSMGSQQNLELDILENDRQVAACYISPNVGVSFHKSNRADADSRIFAFQVASETTLNFTRTSLGASGVGTYETDGLVVRLGATKGVLVSKTTTTSLNVRVFTLAGVTVTLGVDTAVTVPTMFSTTAAYPGTTYIGGTQDEGQFYAVSPADDVFVVMLQGSPSLQRHLIAFTVSGTTVTAGSVLTISGVTENAGGLAVVDATILYVFAAVAADKTYIYKINRSGATLSMSGVIAGPFNTDIKTFLTLDSGDIVGHSLTTTQLSVWMEGMSPSFVGAVQEDVAAGDTANILVSGVDTHQTGLQPGAKYRVLDGSLSLISEAVNDEDVVKDDAVTVLSSTSILVG